MRKLQLGAWTAIVIGVVAAMVSGQSGATERVVTAPVPALDAPLQPGKLATAVLAGGCFWGVEGVFEHVKGVRSVRSGYAGGKAATAQYELTSSGLTGHAEAVEITYDPAQVSYGTLLRVFFSVATDPTQLNRQGPDSGPQYRNAIFARSPEQARLAKAYIAQLGAAKVWPGKIVTTLETAPFYPAEAYHQDFLKRNPAHGYIVVNDLPKVAALKRLLPMVWSEKASA